MMGINNYDLHITQVGEDDTSESDTECLCSKLTPTTNVFSSGVSVPSVNTIDFNNVFSNFFSLLAGNPTTFSVILGTLAIYLFLCAVLRRFDKRDIERVSWSLYLRDPNDHLNRIQERKLSVKESISQTILSDYLFTTYSVHHLRG